MSASTVTDARHATFDAMTAAIERWHGDPDAIRTACLLLIAAGEARAVEKAMGLARHFEFQMQKRIEDCDQLRAEVAKLHEVNADFDKSVAEVASFKANGGSVQELVRLRADAQRLSAEVERLNRVINEFIACENGTDWKARAEKAEAEVENAKGYIALQVARAETAEREVERLKKIRPVSVFERNPDDPAVGDVYSMEQSNARLLESARDELVNCAKRAEKAEAELAEQQWLKESAIKRSKELIAELAEVRQAHAKERARLGVLRKLVIELRTAHRILGSQNEYAPTKAWCVAMDAAMKENTQ